MLPPAGRMGSRAGDSCMGSVGPGPGGKDLAGRGCRLLTHPGGTFMSIYTRSLQVLYTLALVVAVGLLTVPGKLSGQAIRFRPSMPPPAFQPALMSTTPGASFNGGQGVNPVTGTINGPGPNFTSGFNG